MHINEGKGKLALFSTKECFTYPPPFSFLFSSSSTVLLISLLNFLFPLHNINLSPPPPHSFLSSSFAIFIIFPPQSSLLSSSTILLFSLLHLHLLIYSIYFSIHKYIDLLSTLHRPTSTLHRPHIDPTSTLDNHHHIFSLLNFFYTLGNFCFKLGWVLIKTNSRWRREARRTTADYNGIEEA